MRLSHLSAALVAMLVGYGASVALLLAAAAAVGATPAQTISWVAAVSVAKGLGSAGLSLWSRVPVVLAWSTPGAALIAATTGVDMAHAAGAFLLAGALVALTGLVPVMERAVRAIPGSVAAAMLAGVLLPFVMAVARQAVAAPALVLPLVAVFLAVRLWNPLYAVLATLVVGLALGWQPSGGDLAALPFIWVTPQFDPGVALGLGVPLYLVTMASQNLPGFAVMAAQGYAPPVRAALLTTGLGSMLIAPLGAHTFNMAAITAAICMGDDVDPDRNRRWRVGVVYGALWVIVGWLTPVILPAMLALPAAVVASVAGLALIPALTGAISAAMADEPRRFAAILTFTVTASGVAAFGIGAAFWGLCAGLLALALDALKARLFR